MDKRQFAPILAPPLSAGQLIFGGGASIFVPTAGWFIHHLATRIAARAVPQTVTITVSPHRWRIETRVA
jgi:hypothetical protein